jgi:hypothetical protein
MMGPGRFFSGSSILNGLAEVKAGEKSVSDTPETYPPYGREFAVNCVKADISGE